MAKTKVSELSTEDLERQVSEFWQALDATMPFEGACVDDLNDKWLEDVFRLMHQWNERREVNSYQRWNWRNGDPLGMASE